MEKEKDNGNDSNPESQIGTEIFEGSVDRTEDVDTKSPRATTTPLAESNTLDVPDGGLVAWLQVLGAFVIMLSSWGLINSFGVYQTYYETDLLESSSSSDISWIGSLQGALLNMGGLISGPLFDAGHFRALTISGSVLVVLGLFMTSLCETYWQVLLAQGVAVGVGSGFLFLPSAAILSQYFARRRALALGLQSAGSPVGGIVFSILFMRPRVAPPQHKRAFFDRDAFRDVPFLSFSVSGLASFMGMYVPFFYLQLFALRRGIASDDLAAYLVTLLNAGSVFGRILPNFVADYLGSMNMLAAMTLGASILAFGWLGVHDLGGTITFALLFGFFNGGVTSLPPSAIVTLTPDLGRLGTRMGMLFAFIGIAVLVGTPIAGAILKDVNDDGAWEGLIGYCAATLFMGGLGFVGTQMLHLRRMRRTKM
ncbi:hypothetical protein Daesc_009732 [Daldinia eschscholtzii]|uniref:Major facilitator superfamily (MFS) profile domain-containing protein n=1 Tax=Daldinia eschscholtzii TaxID=292717 RepID=A0AAX6MAH5_9PEZI